MTGIRRNTIKSKKIKRSTEEQMSKHPPWVTLLFVKCVTYKSTTADCILMKPEIMMHFITAFPHCIARHHHLLMTLYWLDLTISLQLFQEDIDHFKSISITIKHSETDKFKQAKNIECHWTLSQLPCSLHDISESTPEMACLILVFGGVNKHYAM